MSPNEITAFFETRRHRVFKTQSCWWYNEYHQRRILQSFPIHRLINPGRKEIADLFQSARGTLAVRFIGPAESKGQVSSIWVCRKPYDLKSLSAKSRNQTRRGLEKCQVRKMTWEEVEAVATEAHTDTMKRHELNGARSLGFGIYLKECPAYEAWGAFADGALAAFMVTLWVEDWVHILIQRSVNSYLKFRPNNALVFGVVKEILSRQGVSAVSYGLEPLNSLQSLEDFKLGMGFVKEPVCQRIIVAPWLKPLINPLTCWIVEAAASLRRNNARLQKAAGICRIVRES